ncbi:MAG: hypothetical protein ABS62_10305 [Microbacterium sp. SCN 70-200]|uniref:hypothetical protein n=1 Tax=unclassified Microbacterium TaxID=2609290 RepID=UPI0008685A4C|nr:MULTISPECIES: hypothetical protein [unclassified Microbacterium]MBN9213327.1 hypothetical protein [Microbacterium sp.]ODT40550.1 MAG: hypothetical protein ABS62_10305 [Microbacterium sp. SCN 70-200]OJV84978.1 MAG: hypothetical protein BGO46_10275 [Microbacterium sp. 70-16]
MDDELRNAQARREILAAYVTALDDPARLLRVCAEVGGDNDDARRAVAAAFGVSVHAADAILALQVRRFTPREIDRVRGELAEVDRRLRVLGA